MNSFKHKPLWRCPLCGHKFVTPNLWHSCGRYKIADHFRGKSPDVRQAFDALLKAARRCGRVTVYAQKTRIVFQARVRFAGIIVRKNWLDAGLWLKRRVKHPRLARVEDFGKLGFGLHFHLRNRADIDSSLGLLVKEAYRDGQQGRRAAAPASSGGVSVRDIGA